MAEPFRAAAGGGAARGGGRCELSVQPRSAHGPLLLAHTTHDGRLQVFAADVLRATGRELRAAHPLFVYTLPPRALPHSVVVGAHTIVCVRSAAPDAAATTAADDARVLVLSRALAEEGRHARVRHLMPDGLLQSLPLPDADAASRLQGAIAFGADGDGCVLWGRRGAYELRVWVAAERVCHGLLLSGDARKREQAELIARTRGLDADHLAVRAAAALLARGDGAAAAPLLDAERRRRGGGGGGGRRGVGRGGVAAASVGRR